MHTRENVSTLQIDPYVFDKNKEKLPLFVSALEAPEKFIRVIHAKHNPLFDKEDLKTDSLKTALTLAKENKINWILIGKNFFHVKEVKKFIYLPSSLFNARPEHSLEEINQFFSSIVNQIKTNTTLSMLRLGKNLLTLDNLQKVSELRYLKFLSIYSHYQDFSEQNEKFISGLLKLSQLNYLSSLSLRHIDIGNPGFAAICNIQTLIKLTCAKTDISDITPIKQLYFLKELHLINNKISNGFSEIQHLPFLNTLALRSNTIKLSLEILQLILKNQAIQKIILTNAFAKPSISSCIALLAQQEQLKEINLNYNWQITNEHLKPLLTHLTLKKLYFMQTSSVCEKYPILKQLATTNPKDKWQAYQSTEKKPQQVPSLQLLSFFNLKKGDQNALNIPVSILQEQAIEYHANLQVKTTTLPSLQLLSFLNLNKKEHDKLAVINSIFKPWQPLSIESNCI